MEKSVIISKYIQELKNELFQEIHEMFKHRNRPTSKRWLKSNEVVKLLGISHSTLQKNACQRYLTVLQSRRAFVL